MYGVGKKKKVFPLQYSNNTFLAAIILFFLDDLWKRST